MALSDLEREIFALDRRAVLTIIINGVTLKGGRAEQGNIDGVDVEFNIEQMPPTASITFPKEQLTALASGLPPWVERGHAVEILGGYGGEEVPIFTGRVKKRRHGVSEDVIDCVGRTGKLTRPYRVSPAKVFTAIDAQTAIIDILDDNGVDFTPAGGERYDIDPILMNDGNPWIMATVVAARMDMAPPSDMIRKIADVYGHRAYELPTGHLRIRPLLEAPAPTGSRTYSTRIGSAGATTRNTLLYSSVNIDAAALLGNVAANTRRSQGFVAAVSGGVVSVQMFVRAVGAPTDRVRIRIFRDSAGLPSTAVDADIGSGRTVAGSTIPLGPAYTAIIVNISTATQLSAGGVYHLVIDRTGALDAINYYEVGIDQVAPGYADGRAGVFGGVSWTAVDAAGDFADHPFQIITDAFATLRVLSIEDDEDEDQVKKLVFVEGASIPGVDANGDATTTQITASSRIDFDDLVPGDAELFAMEYQNDLIDTAVVAGEVATRLINKYYRVLMNLEIEVPFDPRMALGSTIAIDDPAVTGLGGNWWVHSYQHSLSASEAATRLSLFGGDQSGMTGKLAPQADFTWIVERELIGAALQTLVTFVATASDQDGWITNYRWLDNYAGGANDVQGGDLTTVTFAYDAATDAAIDMQLTVTDNDGQTTSVTHSIDLQATNEEAYVPLISCAAGNTCMYSNDGAMSWRDIAIPSGSTRTTEIMLASNISDPPILLYGTTTGRIYRSVDANATLALVLDAGAPHPIVDLMQDRANRVWALTSTGRVYVSHDLTVTQTSRGLAWTLYADLSAGTLVRRHDDDPGGPGFINPAPSSRIIGSEPIVNRIWVAGGVGTDPATWFVTNYLADGPNIWFSEIVPGDGVAVSTGVAGDTAAHVVVSHRVSGDLGIGFIGRDVPYIYADPRFYDRPAEWVNGTGFGGLPVLDCRGLAGNNNQQGLFGMVLNSRDFFRCTDGFTWEQLVGVLPGTIANRPNNLLGVSNWRDIFLAATDEGIAKSVDYGSTWAFLRPNAGPGTLWPVGAIGYDIEIEYRRPTQFNVAAIVASGGADPTVENALAIRTTGGDWQDHGPLPTARTGNPHRLWHFPEISDQVLFYVRYSPTTQPYDHSDVLYRTANQGATWTSPVVKIASSTNATPIQITTQVPHGRVTGETVTIDGHLVNTNANGTWVITLVSATQFTLNGSAGNGVGAARGVVALGNALPPMLFTYAMARASNGDLWATGESHVAGHHTGGEHFAHEIFRSQDNGLTWQLIFSDPAPSGVIFAMYRDIAIDPANPARIMAVGWSITANIVTLFSNDATDGLASNWTRTTSGLTFEGIDADRTTPGILAGQNGRWIIGFEAGAVARKRIYTNDQDGVPAAWILRHDLPTVGGNFGFGDRMRAGDVLYFAGVQNSTGLDDPNALLRSLDNGLTWAAASTTEDSINAVVWDAQSDGVIAARASTALRFPYVQPPGPGAAWQAGLDTGLEAAMGYTVNCSPVLQGMAFIRSRVPPSSRIELWAIAQVALAGGDTDIWLREAISDSWRNYLDMPDTVAAENRFGIYHFPGMGEVMFRLKIGDLGSAPDGYGGPLERSADRGLTWTTVLTNVGAVTRSRNGDLWATRDDRAAPASFQPRAIYRSRAADGGISGSWALIATDATASGGLFTKYTQIRVDPNDARRVMAVGGLGNASTMRFAFTSTGQDVTPSFTFGSGAMSFRNGVAADGNFINLEAGGAGRFIVGLSQSNGLAKFIFVTDDAGTNWIQKYTVVTTAVTLGWADSVRAGADLYLAGNGGGAANAVDGRVVRSTDNGDVWTVFTGDNRTGIAAITWHGASSTLFIGRAVAGAGNVLKMQNPLPASVWVDDSIPSDPRAILQEGLEVVP